MSWESALFMPDLFSESVCQEVCVLWSQIYLEDSFSRNLIGPVDPKNFFIKKGHKKLRLFLARKLTLVLNIDFELEREANYYLRLAHNVKKRHCKYIW